MKSHFGFVGLLLVAVVWTSSAVAEDRTVIVTLFDGFSPTMADATQTPNLDRIKHEGAWSRHLVPAFPTLSMTNHTTYATGCWPEHHGIISNTFYDATRGRYDDRNKTNVGDADWRTGCQSMWEVPRNKVFMQRCLIGWGVGPVRAGNSQRSRTRLAISGTLPATMKFSPMV